MPAIRSLLEAGGWAGLGHSLGLWDCQLGFLGGCDLAGQIPVGLWEWSVWGWSGVPARESDGLLTGEGVPGWYRGQSWVFTVLKTLSSRCGPPSLPPYFRRLCLFLPSPFVVLQLQAHASHPIFDLPVPSAGNPFPTLPSLTDRSLTLSWPGTTLARTFCRLLFSHLPSRSLPPYLNY